MVQKVNRRSFFKTSMVLGGSATLGVHSMNDPSHAGIKNTNSIASSLAASALLKMNVVLADTNEPSSSMVRIRRIRNGQYIDSTLHTKPNIWKEFSFKEEDFFDAFTLGPSAHGGFNAVNVPGGLQGYYWCVPNEFEFVLSAGKWEVTIRRGIEFVPFRFEFSIAENESMEKTVYLQRWCDMRESRWYSADSHMHYRIMDDMDARQLMDLIQIEDIHVAMVLNTGRPEGINFEQRGYGPDYRVMEGDFVICPGQEDPYSRSAFSVGTEGTTLGHTVQLNIQNGIHDLENFYLYGLIFDQVHEQGGLSGYTHLPMVDLQLERGGTPNSVIQPRGLSIDVPMGKVDFVDILQFGVLKTDLYYDYLNLGYPLTATAGSDWPMDLAGIVSATPGDGRMYCHIGERLFSADAWLDAMKRGRTFVTNGPMLELSIHDALPGDIIHLQENKLLQVHARTWGCREYSLADQLQIVRNGDVIAETDASRERQEELLDTVEIASGFGGWIAARAMGADGSRAHTTPIYIIREGFRFWKFDTINYLIHKRISELGNIENDIQTIRSHYSEAEAPYALTLFYRQSTALLERIETAREIYKQLLITAEQERERRITSVDNFGSY